MNIYPEYTSTLDAIRTRSAWQLSGDAGCASPDSNDCEGFNFLGSIRNGVIDRVEWVAANEPMTLVDMLDEPHDVVHEIVDGNSTLIYTHRMWSAFVDLAAYQEDPTEMGAETDDMTRAATTCLYMIGERLASVLFAELNDARGEDVAATESIGADDTERNDLDVFVDAYVTAALWSTTCPFDDVENWDDLVSSSEVHAWELDELSADKLDEIRAECVEFITANATDLTELDAAQCGHDFSLTRDHHGAGFWDRGYGEIGTRLTDAAHVYGDTSVDEWWTSEQWAAWEHQGHAITPEG